MVFMLSVVIGYYVIGNVHHALHTPLMSVTNAISGIIVVGALLQVGHDNKLSSPASPSSGSWWPASTSSVASP
jgi:NAD/NADP transhydrogenase alpha subunit